MGKERRINWLGLFIKFIIIFVLILILVWLITKIINKNRLSDTFKNNINNMETAAVNYFKTIDLPLEKGKSTKITLREMLDKDLITSETLSKKNNCDTKDSYSKITRAKNNYKVETRLECGKEKNTITRKFNLEDCKNCIENNNNNNNSKKENNYNNENKSSSNTTNNNVNTSTTSESNIQNKVTYYEYVKEVTSYSKWMKGDLTGNNIENKYEYYKVEDKVYYSAAYIKESQIQNNKTISYTLKLVNVPNKDYYFTSINSSEYLNSNDSSKYINEKDVVLSKNNISINSDLMSSSLTSGNFTYKLSPYYRKGNFYIDVVITINNTNSVRPYYSKDLKTNVYLIPLKINVRFASNNITTTKPSGNYETISYYRYVEKNKDVIWSTKSSVDGYTKTGNTKEE